MAIALTWMHRISSPPSRLIFIIILTLAALRFSKLGKRH
ncbi:hypothetical protein CWATWH8502_3570 [Crocosphaera watsonii WH 8502]|uniref:Uncharacterized protein n=1 Tax=Crocosphaera watsonii WH 8502 TaxID=423474 RepID=T2IBH4_CROWT|nr:hypothetical protein CWATWH8502_3570 [Crocosphaera watsonii WH 8502]